MWHQRPGPHCTRRCSPLTFLEHDTTRHFYKTSNGYLKPPFHSNHTRRRHLRTFSSYYTGHTMAKVGPRPLSPVLLFGLVPIAAWFIIRPLLEPIPSIPALYSSFGFSIFAFLATIYLVPALGPTFVKANLKGNDLLKIYRYEIDM